MSWQVCQPAEKVILVWLALLPHERDPADLLPALTAGLFLLRMILAMASPLWIVSIALVGVCVMMA